MTFQSMETLWKPLAKIAAAMLLSIGLVGCDQKRTGIAPPPAASTPSPEQLAKAKYEMDAKCGADTRAWFKANYSEESEPIRVQSGGAIQTTPPTYQNHYSHKLNGCFALLDSVTTFPPPHPMVIRTHEIYDVNENRRVGVVVQKDLEIITACSVEATKCTTQEEFIAMARGYLAE